METIFLKEKTICIYDISEKKKNLLNNNNINWKLNCLVLNSYSYGPSICLKIYSYIDTNEQIIYFKSLQQLRCREVEDLFNFYYGEFKKDKIIYTDLFNVKIF